VITNILEECITSIFRLEGPDDGGNMFVPLTQRSLPTRLHGVTTHIFTAMKLSNLIHSAVVVCIVHADDENLEG
jgi:hypothetical protein